MVKSIIKEIIIILLLLLAVILALGVLFYDYIPNNKQVPSVLTYKTSDSISNEIAEPIVENEAVLVTYEITAEDLRQLQVTKEYTPGKVNPFSTYADPVQNTPDENNVTNVNGSISGNVGTPSGNSANRNSSSGNTFYKNTGTK